MDKEILASKQEGYVPNYELIKRNELVRTGDRRTLIRNMDDSISDFFSFTTEELNQFIQDALDNYDFSGVIDMDALNRQITQMVDDKVAEAIADIDIPIPEVDLTEIKQELLEYVNETLAEAIAAIDVKDGADGKSAYQYAVEGGYTGTEAQFSVQLDRLMQIIDADEVGY